MITKFLPVDWKDLQNKVSEILTQSNFLTKVEYNLSSVRGRYEIDVYAEENIDDRKYKIICECKYWKNNVPQSVVLSLRSILNDTGVEKGYIITTSNFQKGSHESSENTNIQLITWNEFQHEFFKSWYLNYFYNQLNNIIETKYSSINFEFYENFEVIEKSEFIDLRNRYFELFRILNHFPSSHIAKLIPDELKKIEKKLPLNESLEIEPWEEDNLLTPIDILNESCFQEFLEKVKLYSEPIYQKINKLNL